MNHTRFAKGRTVRRKPGEMNRTEQAYAALLEARKVAGHVLWYEFDAIKLRLADKTFLTVDFFVMTSDGLLEAHEVKGHWEDDARVKMKVAADKYPFVFKAFRPLPKREGGGWAHEEF